MAPLPGSVPLLSCAETRSLETRLFAGDEAKEWPAMRRAGQAVAQAVLADAREAGGWPADARVLVLAGKGHNAGDALLAAAELLRRQPDCRVDVSFAFDVASLRPLAARAWRLLAGAGTERVRTIDAGKLAAGGERYWLSLDGIFGFSFRPPAEPSVQELLARANALPVRLRAAVDLPSAGLFQADFTYATGVVKDVVVDAPAAGRVRYLDLGFFRGDEPGEARVLTPALLAPLAGLRPPASDKRTFGHVLLVGGSRDYPGAILMSVLAALQSGAGLVTAFVPESLVPAFAARAPEAMWVGWPETPAGSLALEGEHLLRARYGRATALMLGPGLGREPETLALARSIVAGSPLPLVIDADALQPEIVRSGAAARILTPHAGEFSRIAGERELPAFAAETGATIVLKGPVTRLVSGSEGTRYHSFLGGPALARGGSGDLLAGLTGGLLAQTPGHPLLAAARGVVWHGRSADLLAQARGPTSIRVTQLLDFLPAALREQ